MAASSIHRMTVPPWTFSPGYTSRVWATNLMITDSLVSSPAGGGASIMASSTSRRTVPRSLARRSRSSSSGVSGSQGRTGMELPCASTAT
ncbi:hypothetical protein ACFFX0_15700 [Citricoccus parietis]|uniref:Uncharacterized protein n=1 Tax=Citricoccus parietis TaxID=592307 RepID=A0ABV5G0V4_9MICC